MTVHEVDEFLNFLIVVKGRSPRTIESYRSDLAGLSKWLAERNLPLEDATDEDIDNYLSLLRSIGRAPSTVSRVTSALKGYFSYLVDEGKRSQNPTARLQPAKRPKGLPRPLTESYIDALINSIVGDGALELRDRLIIEFLYGTGCRVSEMLAVRESDLDFDESAIRVTGKGSRQRIVPMGRSLQTALRRYLDGGARSSLGVRPGEILVFLNHRGAALSRHGVNEMLIRRARQAGLATLDLHAHSFRHSCATHMLAHGADIRVVQELLGHGSIATTQRYTGVSMTTLRETYSSAHPRALDR